MGAGEEASGGLPSTWESEVHRWAQGFARAVRDVDYAHGRDYFAPDVVSCGTRSDVLEGLDDLEQRQWRGVWGNTRDFAFSTIRIVDWCLDGEAPVVVVLAEWRSTARGGDERRREGRATLVLRSAARSAMGSRPALKCVHSHFSLRPTEWADDT